MNECDHVLRILRVGSEATVSGPSRVISIVEFTQDIYSSVIVAAAACILSAISGNPVGTVVR